MPQLHVDPSVLGLRHAGLAGWLAGTPLGSALEKSTRLEKATASEVPPAPSAGPRLKSRRLSGPVELLAGSAPPVSRCILYYFVFSGSGL